MKIIFLTLKTFSATGGIEKFNRCFCKALAENADAHSWQVETLSAYDTQPDERYISASRFRGFGRNRRQYFIAALAAMRSADIIIFAHINLSPLMRLCRLVYPRKTSICIAHGREVWEPLTAMQSKALRSVDEVWAVSHYTAGILTAEKGVHESRIRIFPNTLDPFFAAATASVSPLALRERYGISEGDKVLLTVARLASTEKYKGYDAVIELLPRLAKRYPGLKYLLAGKWEEEEKKRITNIISAIKLHNVVILTGFVEDDELIAHYGMADLFVLPSRKEGFGIVFLEAAWCGLPVIAGNRDGSAEALLQGRLGILIDPGDRRALENAIMEALSSPISPGEKSARQIAINRQYGFDQFKKSQFQLLEQAAKA